jgi:adenylate kinase family enzyme
MKRVVVIGTTGSGKTTMAKRVAEAIGCTAFDIDDFHWQPGWVERMPEEMIELFREALKADKWTLAGNHSRTRDFTWAQADTVIWLNYSFWVVFPRLLWRTIKRVVTKEEVMPGCVETFQSQFLIKDSLLVWFFQTFWKRKKEYPEIINQDKYQHLTVLEFKHPRQAKRFLLGLQEKHK